jgi:hypothetical protein
VCLLLGALVGRVVGDASVGGNVGALVGLVIIALNVMLSLRYMRRRFDPASARAEGEPLGREAGPQASERSG